MRLPLIEIALPTFQQLSYQQYKLFLKNLNILIKADGRISLSEWARYTMISKNLSKAFDGQHTHVRFKSLKAVRSDIETVLSILAYANDRTEVSPEISFAAGSQALNIDIALAGKEQLSLLRMTRALDNLSALHPLRKPQLLKACVRTIVADNSLGEVEEELLRTISDSLDCPMPPIRAI